MGRKSRRSTSPIAKLVQRLNWAHNTSAKTGIPADELLDKLKQQEEIQHVKQQERREFIKHMSMGVAAASTMGAASTAFAGKGGGNPPPSSGTLDVAIIGGGPAGMYGVHPPPRRQDHPLGIGHDSRPVRHGREPRRPGNR